MSPIKCMTKELMLAMAPACLLVEYFFGIMWLYDEMMELFHSPLTSIFIFYFGVYLCFDVKTCCVYHLTRICMIQCI